MIPYEEFRRRSSFTGEELMAFAKGTLFNDGPEGFACRLPLPPMLMLDRILEIKGEGPRGRIVAERDNHPDDIFFRCHFKDDPVQPGCLSVDAVWQMIGFFCAWSGGIGAGRALGCKEVFFESEVRPSDSVILYEVTVRRFTILERSGAAMAIGNGDVFADGRHVCSVKDAKVGIFKDIVWTGEPAPERGAGRGSAQEG
ncbi:MAG: bifunctional 3-hydroxydecanoyl-ACP dehydratase/trans-2-decenoyl-ACP isomerase [Deltaproteobacteria bacterium]|nr:bifunctional 3-hydroxydecanoyl-ACP dehydratase/trans-2-decenoyl-ACP isomerase [Deltaproteobacteria bacterium]